MILVNTGKLALIDSWTNDATLDSRVHLFKNNIGAIVIGTVLADLTEADFDGYASQNLIGLPDATINGGNQGESDSGTFIFTAGAGLAATQTAYGAYISINTPAGVRKLMFAEKFAQPQSVVIVGDTVQLKVNLFCDQL